MILKVLKAVGHILIIPFALIFFFIFITVIDPIWQNLKKRDLEKFLREFGKDDISSKLLVRIRSLGITIGVLPLSEQIFVGVGMKIRVAVAYHSLKLIPEKLEISNAIIQEFLRGKISKEKVQLSLAHELGHIRNDRIHAVNAANRFKACKIGIENSCLCEELAACHEAIKIIFRETLKDPRELFLEEDLALPLKIAVNQCPECVKLIAKSPEKCPLIKELRDFGFSAENKSETAEENTKPA